MATISKTQATSLISLQQIASNSVVKSSAQDVSAKLGATIFIHLGRDDTGGALTTAVTFRIQASAKSAADDQWYDIVSFISGVTVPEAEAVTGTENAGATVIEVASTTNLTVGDFILFKNGTIGNSEWGRIIAVSTNTSITVMDAITNAQTGSTIYDQAEQFIAQLDLTSIGRIRVVADCSGTGRTVVVEAFMVTGDSIG
jgi:hypothetical protein